MTVSDRERVLEDALKVVTADRMTDYGTPEQNFQRIASYWSVLFGITVEPWQVAAAMSLLKIARLQNNPAHLDSLIDLAGYAACWADVTSER